MPWTDRLRRELATSSPLVRHPHPPPARENGSSTPFVQRIRDLASAVRSRPPMEGSNQAALVAPVSVLRISQRWPRASVGHRNDTRATFDCVHRWPASGYSTRRIGGDSMSCRKHVAPVEPHPFLKCGDRVIVKCGPLLGIQGILIRKKNLYRLVLSVEMLGNAAAVEMDASPVERLNIKSPGRFRRWLRGSIHTRGDRNRRIHKSNIRNIKCSGNGSLDPRQYSQTSLFQYNYSRYRQAS